MSDLALVEAMDCDVLLLTEVSERAELPGHDLHLGESLGVIERRGSAVRLNRGKDGLEQNLEQISCGIPVEFGPITANENSPRSCVSAGQGPFSGYAVDQMS